MACPTDGPQDPANARLIAEASTMLEALKRLASMEAFDVATVHVPAEVVARVDYARAILARIEGSK